MQQLQEGGLHQQWFLCKAQTSEKPGMARALSSLEETRKTLSGFLLIPEMVITYCDQSKMEAEQGQEGHLDKWCIIILWLLFHCMNNKYRYRTKDAAIQILSISHIHKNSISKKTLVARWLSGSLSSADHKLQNISTHCLVHYFQESCFKGRSATILNSENRNSRSRKESSRGHVLLSELLTRWPTMPTGTHKGSCRFLPG